MEREIREKGVISAPTALDDVVLRHARNVVNRPTSWLDNEWLRFAAGFVPFLDLALMVSVVVRGKRFLVIPEPPGLAPFRAGLKLGGLR